jgi:hypothetical protein
MSTTATIGRKTVMAAIVALALATMLLFSGVAHAQAATSTWNDHSHSSNDSHNGNWSNDSHNSGWNNGHNGSSALSWYQLLWQQQQSYMSWLQFCAYLQSVYGYTPSGIGCPVPAVVTTPVITG